MHGAPGLGPPLVLVVDDDPVARRVLAAVVRAAGEFRVQTAATEEEARAATEAEAPRFAVVDVWLRGGDASGLVRWLCDAAQLPDRVVAVTAEPQGDGATRCRDAGAATVLGKPVSPATLAQTLGIQHGSPAAKATLRLLRGALAIVDDAAALDAVTELHQALRVADWATVASRLDPVHTAVLEVSASLAEPEP